MVNTMIDELLFDNQNQNQKLKKENPNQFYFYEKIFKRRKQKYMEYLEIEYGYKVRENERR